MENFASFLARNPPEQEVALVAPNVLELPHGVERWRSDCGCRLAEPHPPAWRAPLRAGLDRLAGELHPATSAEGAPLLGDPWAARDTYGGRGRSSALPCAPASCSSWSGTRCGCSRRAAGSSTISAASNRRQVPALRRAGDRARPAPTPPSRGRLGRPARGGAVATTRDRRRGARCTRRGPPRIPRSRGRRGRRRVMPRRSRGGAGRLRRRRRRLRRSGEHGAPRGAAPPTGRGWTVTAAVGDRQDRIAAGRGGERGRQRARLSVDESGLPEPEREQVGGRAPPGAPPQRAHRRGGAPDRRWLARASTARW